MDIKDLKMFVTVAEELNFRAAAERLNITQPPLTRAIAKLESELEGKLFIRTTRKVQLTRAGIALLKESYELIEKMDAIKASIKQTLRLNQAVIKIGLTPLALHSSAIKAIWAFKETNQSCEIKIIEDTEEQQLKNLKSGKIDIALLHEPISTKEFPEKVILSQEPLGILVAKNHRLATRKRVNINELINETLIIHSQTENKGFTNAIEKYFDINNTKIKLYYKQKNENCCLLAATGAGILLTTAAMSKFAVDEVNYIPLIGKNAKISIAATWLNKETPINQLFIHFLESEGYIKTPKSPCLVSLANW